MNDICESEVIACIAWQRSVLYSPRRRRRRSVNGIHPCVRKTHTYSAPLSAVRSEAPRRASAFGFTILHSAFLRDLTLQALG